MEDISAQLQTNMLSDNFIIKAKIINQQHRQRKQREKDQIAFNKFCRENLTYLNDNSKPDLVEIDRLSHIFISKTTPTQLIQSVLIKFPQYKHQINLVEKDDNDDQLIALTSRRYEIISMRVQEEQLVIAQSKKPKAKSYSNILSSRKRNPYQ